MPLTPKWGIINRNEPQKALQASCGRASEESFEDFVRLAEQFGFRLSRVSGSHHIMVNGAIGEILTLQGDKNGQAKPYQIRQLLDLVSQYRLEME